MNLVDHYSLNGGGACYDENSRLTIIGLAECVSQTNDDYTNYSTDAEDNGRSSTSEGKSFSYRYSTLKRAAGDDGAGPSGTTSDTVNRSTEISLPHFTQGCYAESICMSLSG